MRGKTKPEKINLQLM